MYKICIFSQKQNHIVCISYYCFYKLLLFHFSVINKEFKINDEKT